MNFQNTSFMKCIKERILLHDGSKGYVLQEMGLKGGECPELWNVTHPEKVTLLYRMYKDAGANVIQTNTFQGNPVQLEKYSLAERTYELNYEGARLARQVMGRDGYVSASVGPLGRLFEPSGELSFDEAYEAFALQVKALADGGADVINLETFTDIAEMRAALIASIETTCLPVICSLAFEQNGRTLMGTDPFNAAITLKSLGASMTGTNCSGGPEQQLEILKEMSKVEGIYFSVKPNAGLPEMVDGKTIYKQTPEKFAEIFPEYIKYGARLIGGCCGTTPEHIKAMSAVLKEMKPISAVTRNTENEADENAVTDKVVTKITKTGGIITSPYRICEIFPDNQPTVIKLTDVVYLGKITDALGKPEEIVDIALDVSSEDMDALYIDLDEFPEMLQSGLPEMVNMMQGYIRAPIIFKSLRPEILDKTLRIYRGRAGVVLEDYRADTTMELLRTVEKYGAIRVENGLIRNT